jgi:hypothetical protein
MSGVTKGKDFCWAQSLGNCGGGRSREHVVSKSILKLFSAVRVVGFRWCKEPLEVGTNLMAKHLCEVHNNSLTSTDETALRLFKLLRDYFDETAQPKELAVEVEMDGLLLERWFLKTAINLIVSHGEPLKWPQSEIDAALPESLVRTAFGLDGFRWPAGLYFFGGQGQRVDSADGVKMQALHQDDDSLGGVQWYFRGLDFISWIEMGEQPVWMLSNGTLLRADEIGSPLRYHPERFTFKGGNGRSCDVNFRWPQSNQGRVATDQLLRFR